MRKRTNPRGTPFHSIAKRLNAQIAMYKKELKTVPMTPDQKKYVEGYKTAMEFARLMVGDEILRFRNKE